MSRTNIQLLLYILPFVNLRLHCLSLQTIDPRVCGFGLSGLCSVNKSQSQLRAFAPSVAASIHRQVYLQKAASIVPHRPHPSPTHPKLVQQVW